jgi:hypothetical protein
MQRQLVAHCENCEKQVIASEVVHFLYNDGPSAPIWRYSILQCNDCGNPMVVYEEDMEDGLFHDPIWLHPSPPRDMELRVPAEIRQELEEGRKCLNNGLYTAAVVMSGRTLEGVTRAYGVQGRNLYRALQELNRQGTLDGRFVEWAGHLRVLRNEAAHFTGSKVSAEDAADALALTEAIVTYLFIFTKRFDEFVRRRGVGGQAPMGVQEE